MLVLKYFRIRLFCVQIRYNVQIQEKKNEYMTENGKYCQQSEAKFLNKEYFSALCRASVTCGFCCVWSGWMLIG